MCRTLSLSALARWRRALGRSGSVPATFCAGTVHRSTGLRGGAFPHRRAGGVRVRGGPPCSVMVPVRQLVRQPSPHRPTATDAFFVVFCREPRPRRLAVRPTLGTQPTTCSHNSLHLRVRHATIHTRVSHRGRLVTQSYSALRALYLCGDCPYLPSVMYAETGAVVQLRTPRVAVGDCSLQH